MDDSNPANCIEDPEYPENYDGEVVEESFELTWKDHIERARTGDTGATRTVMHACIRFLKGMGWSLNSKDWDSRIPMDAKGYPPAGYVPEPLFSFLIDTLEKAMSASRKGVGEAMGMGKPPRPPKNREESEEFLNRYSSAVGGEYPVQLSKHPEVVKSIAKRMNLHKDTVQHYWKLHEPLVFEFGFPPPKYERNADVYEDLATIINRYLSLINTPVHNGNTTRTPVYNIIVQKIASQIGKNFSVVERYLKFFDQAGTDIFDLPKSGDPDEELFEDLVIFIDLYNSLMNSPHFENGAALPQRRKETLKTIAMLLDKSLTSVERYWKVFERTVKKYQDATNNG